ncbi:MAG TPA: type III pantothenate kinase [Bacteroidales bacterium]|nr:type III pantothenate kinase [Bacteroidales bacterium]HRZ76309.1 type III pantothenate kinase [Bacteroidales bacterium]
MPTLSRCIAIDAGNTRGKAAELAGLEVLRRWDFDPADPLAGPDFPWGLPSGLPIGLSSVRPLDGALLDHLRSIGDLLVLSGSTPLPFRSAYLTPSTLGPDRLALAAGAMALFPGKDLLVVDAGTCITCDLILGGAVFEGGGISPGLSMRLQALHQFTGALPLVAVTEGQWYPGRSTRDSILAGVMGGAVGEVRDLASRMRRKYPGLQVVVTGGDAAHFVKNLKNSIFAGPDLVLQGVRAILQHHVNTHS